MKRDELLCLKIFRALEFFVAADGGEGGPVVGMAIAGVVALEEGDLRLLEGEGGGELVPPAVAMERCHQLRRACRVDGPERSHNKRNSGGNERTRSTDKPLAVVLPLDRGLTSREYDQPQIAQVQ